MAKYPGVTAKTKFTRELGPDLDAD